MTPTQALVLRELVETTGRLCSHEIAARAGIRAKSAPWVVRNAVGGLRREWGPIIDSSKVRANAGYWLNDLGRQTIKDDQVLITRLRGELAAVTRLYQQARAELDAWRSARAS